MEKLKCLSPAGRVLVASSLSVLSFAVLFGFVFLAVGLLWMPLFFIGLAIFAAIQILVLSVFIESKTEAAND